MYCTYVQSTNIFGVVQVTLWLLSFMSQKSSAALKSKTDVFQPGSNKGPLRGGHLFTPFVIWIVFNTAIFPRTFRILLNRLLG